MADDQRRETAQTPAQNPAQNPWYEESWAVMTAGVTGVLAIGVLIYAVVQTAEHSVEPTYGNQYYTDYSASTTSATSTTTSRSARSTTSRTTSTRTTSTSATSTTSSTPPTSTAPSLDDDNPFILNPFATTTTADAG